MAGVQHEDPTMMRSLSGTGTPVGEMHTEAPRTGPIPICVAYISVNGPASGTLAKGKRMHSGRKAHWGRERVRQGRDRIGVVLETASGRLRVGFGGKFTLHAALYCA
ncbi:hypothetical protein [Parapedobacter sp. 10938]|uniref:hypothetical protein n=1 Tax=Parapedobacter flavus TaxID=3110225 RepID=UPI002DBED3EE|nr:hypothetical protein [Parapedobacter sp. 10938]MEC3878197.1 hypothetical protein [Parapedobacter sp. 10938]